MAPSVAVPHVYPRVGGVDQGHKVAVEVGDQLEVVDQELESGQPATDQIMGKLGRSAAAAAATAEAPAGTDTPATGQWGRATMVIVLCAFAELR